MPSSDYGQTSFFSVKFNHFDSESRRRHARHFQTWDHLVKVRPVRKKQPISRHNSPCIEWSTGGDATAKIHPAVKIHRRQHLLKGVCVELWCNRTDAGCIFTPGCIFALGSPPVPRTAGTFFCVYLVQNWSGRNTLIYIYFRTQAQEGREFILNIFCILCQRRGGRDLFSFFFPWAEVLKGREL